jgi:hypothetical protein
MRSVWIAAVVEESVRRDEIVDAGTDHDDAEVLDPLEARKNG